MNADREALKTWIEIAKHFFEILAIIIAGVWTYSVFIQKDAPTLELRAIIESNLTWTKIANDNSCAATMKVHFENTGTSTIDVTKVRIRGWSFYLDKSGNSFSEFLDLEKIQNEGNLFFDKTYIIVDDINSENLPPPFVQRYSSGEMYTHDFTWIIASQQDSQVLFFVQLFAEDDKRQTSWKTYTWGAPECIN